MHLSTVKILIDLGRDKPSASIYILIVKAIFLTYLHYFCITFKAIVSYILVRQSLAPDRFGLFFFIMLTEPTFCRNSSINISIDNRYYNRFIHLRRPIFTVNHNGACVYNPDNTWDRACAFYIRDTMLTQSATWVSDHRYSTARFSYCFVSPLRLQ